MKVLLSTIKTTYHLGNNVYGNFIRGEYFCWNTWNIYNKMNPIHETFKFWDKYSNRSDMRKNMKLSTFWCRRVCGRLTMFVLCEQCVVCLDDLEIGTQMVRLDCHVEFFTYFVNCAKVVQMVGLKTSTHVLLVGMSWNKLVDICCSYIWLISKLFTWGEICLIFW